MREEETPERVRILITDDNEPFRRGIRSLLEERPEWLVIGEATDGLEAVELARSLRPDLVLMDISMPHMDGFSATKIIRGERPELPVIIVSQNDAAMVRASGVRVEAFVAKSSISRDLVPTIDRIVEATRRGESTLNSPPPSPAPDSRRANKPIKVHFSEGMPAPGHEFDGKTNLLASIVDSSDDAIVSKNLQGTVTSWNRGAERLFGYSAREMVGQPITLIIPPDRHAEETEILARIHRDERVDHFETIRRRKDGTLVDVSVTISPVKDETGRVVGASKVARDISEQRLVQAALQESERRLRSLSESLESTVRQRTQELELQAEQLRELSRRLQQGQDEERRRIARELHDSAGQVLAVLSYNLGVIRENAQHSESSTKAVHDSEQLVEQMLREIRTISYLLHPPLLDESGLPGALDYYARGISERSNFEIELDIDSRFGRLPEEMELALFRIVQECLTNIHRHSASKTARIHLSRNDRRVCLEVQDQGHGISPAKLAGIQHQRTGVGIAGIRERARQFGGVLTLESSEKGTIVMVTIPLTEPGLGESRSL